MIKTHRAVRRFAAVVIAASVAAGGRSGAADASIKAATREEHAVYAALVALQMSERVRVDPVARVPRFETWGSGLAGLKSETLADYQRQSPARLTGPFPLPPAIKIELAPIEPCVARAGPLQMSFSRVGFSRDSNQALVAVSIVRTNSSESAFFLLEKQRGAWHVVASRFIEAVGDLCHL